MAQGGLPDIVVYILLAPIAIFAIWHLNSALVPPREPPPTLREKRIVLLIAHPDDESMFFAPTLQKLTAPSLGNHVKILCLSSGNADGLGETRKKELEVAAVKLGLRNREDVFVMDDVGKFKDGMKENWDEKEVAKVLAQAFAPDSLMPQGKKGKSKESSGPRATIDVLVTFDAKGVSSHPNHISLFHGSRQFITNLMHGYSGYACPITMYTLSSVNILRKYSFILDILPTYVAGIVEDVVEGARGTRRKSSQGQISKFAKGDRVIFINDLAKYWSARSAMVYGHKSQMVWFRWGWIGVGRYMVVNDLKRVYVY